MSPVIEVNSGSSRASPYTGNIEYIATGGSHIFSTGGTNEKKLKSLIMEMLHYQGF